MVTAIGFTVLAACVLAMRAAVRSSHFYVRCPMCGMEREYEKRAAIQRVNTMTPREIAEREGKTLACARWRWQHYSNAPAEWVRDGGCNADLVWLYLQHPFVRNLFTQKAQLESARQFQEAHMDATEQEKLP
jgi:hypothetical protein